MFKIIIVVAMMVNGLPATVTMETETEAYYDTLAACEIDKAKARTFRFYKIKSLDCVPVGDPDES